MARRAAQAAGRTPDQASNWAPDQSPDRALNCPRMGPGPGPRWSFRLGLDQAPTRPPQTGPRTGPRTRALNEGPGLGPGPGLGACPGPACWTRPWTKPHADPRPWTLVPRGHEPQTTSPGPWAPPDCGPWAAGPDRSLSIADPADHSAPQTVGSSASPPARWPAGRLGCVEPSQARPSLAELSRAGRGQAGLSRAGMDHSAELDRARPGQGPHHVGPDWTEPAGLGRDAPSLVRPGRFRPDGPGRARVAWCSRQA